jgi:hypothetical protein
MKNQDNRASIGRQLAAGGGPREAQQRQGGEECMAEASGVRCQVLGRARGDLGLRISEWGLEENQKTEASRQRGAEKGGEFGFSGPEWREMGLGTRERRVGEEEKGVKPSGVDCL